jgi:hypothetical protein
LRDLDHDRPLQPHVSARPVGHLTAREGRAQDTFEVALVGTALA